MKRTLLAAFCLLFGAYTQAQTFTSGHITVVVTDSMSHDSTYCTSNFSPLYTITIDSSYAGEVLNIVDTASWSLISSFTNFAGDSPWIVTQSMYPSPYPDYYLSMSGGYATSFLQVSKITCGTDTLRYVVVSDSMLVTNPCAYSTVSGLVYADNNGNCIYDAGDMQIYPPPVGVLENLSSPVGTTGFATEWGATGSGSYTFQLQQSWLVSYYLYLPAYYAFIFPLSPCFSGSYTFTSLPQTGADFPLVCTSNIDVQCYPMGPGSVRLHQPFYMQPYVSNTGCDSAAGTLTFVKDSRVIYDSSLSLYPADTVRGDTLIWNYSGLSNISGGAYWNSFFSDVYLTQDSTVVVGDTLCFRTYTNIPAADIDPLNNDNTVCIPVVYSYDPNVKVVTPKGTGAEGFVPSNTDTLTYDLHFQNTGSDVANNINIIDTLDSHINPASLRILGTSHNMTPQWLAPGVVQFNYDYINLPDSSANEPASHGSVRFSVALNPSLAAGTQIKNTGYIYFDLNPAVVTNTTLNTIMASTNVHQIATQKPVKVYPNPATDRITVENLSNGEISILNVSGVVMLKQDIVNDKTIIDLSDLPAGIYILKTVSGATSATNKFTKY